MTRYTSLAVFLFFALALIVPSGFSLGAAMLVLGTIVLIIKRPAFKLNRQDTLLIGVFVLYFAVNTLLNIVHGAPEREYDAPARFLLATIALLLLLNYPPKPVWIWSGLGLGSLGAGIYAIWQIFVTGLERAEGTTNPIQYGNISLILGTLSLLGVYWAWQQRHHLLLVLAGAGALLGILGSLFTGSRGSWVALPVCIAILAVYSYKHFSHRVLAGGVTALVLFFVVLYQIPQTGIKARLGLVDKEVAGYVEGGDASTSIGTRLEMWRLGARLAPEHPLIGWGKAGYMEEAKRLAAEGQIGITPTEHSHLHNEYIDALVKRGIIGLLALLLLYAAPLVLFIRQLKSGDKTTAPYALAGILLYTSYIMFGLTQAFLTHNNGVMILAFTTMIIWARARHHESA